MRRPVARRSWFRAPSVRGRACAGPGDASEGYALLLRLVGEELAQDLPGLFGSDGVAALVPVPAGTLRHAVEVLDQPGLASCWTDDMSLGWVTGTDASGRGRRPLNRRGPDLPHSSEERMMLSTRRVIPCTRRSAKLRRPSRRSLARRCIPR
jgi:hypothetical protein